MDVDLLARTLAILATGAAPYLQEWGGKAAEAALRSVVGEKAKQAAETLGLLKPKIEEKPVAKGSIEALANEDLDHEDAADAEETLRKQLLRLLQADQGLAGALLEKLKASRSARNGGASPPGRISWQAKSSPVAT